MANSNQLAKKVTCHGVKFEAEIYGIPDSGQTQNRIYTSFRAVKHVKWAR